MTEPIRPHPTKPTELAPGVVWEPLDQEVTVYMEQVSEWAPVHAGYKLTPAAVLMSVVLTISKSLRPAKVKAWHIRGGDF